VLFAPRPFARLLAGFAAMFSGRAAEEGRSALAGRLGQKVGAGNVAIIDDATLPDSPAARPFDAEGVPTRRLPVVDDGIFGAFLHTSDTARRAGQPPTGHAVRSYQSIPAVAPSNLFVSAGEKSPEELRAGAGLEVTVIMGSHTDPVSGEFSLPALGYRLKDGRRERPLHNFTVAGNFLELLSSVRAVGADFSFGLPGMGSAVGSGSVLVSGVSVGGGS
jgi:PmbA protein